MVIDGKEMPNTLFELVMQTQQGSAKNSVIGIPHTLYIPTYHLFSLSRQFEFYQGLQDSYFDAIHSGHSFFIERKGSHLQHHLNRRNP